MSISIGQLTLEINKRTEVHNQDVLKSIKIITASNPSKQQLEKMILHNKNYITKGKKGGFKCYSAVIALEACEYVLKNNFK